MPDDTNSHETGNSAQASAGRGPASWTAAACMLAALAAAALFVDLPVARAARASAANGPPDWRKPIDLCEAFGHRYGLALIGATVAAFEVSRRRIVARILAAAYFGGFACDALKLLVARERPYRAALEGSALDTFVAWLPLGSVEFLDKPYDRGFQSFPSGHAGAATALGLALAWRYPRAAPWMLALSLLAALQRVLSEQHYPSDVLLGAAIGALVAAAAHHSRAAGAWFDRFEGVAASGGE